MSKEEKRRAKAVTCFKRNPQSEPCPKQESECSQVKKVKKDSVTQEKSKKKKNSLKGHGGNKKPEQPVVVESTLAVPLGDSLGLVAAAVAVMPAAAAAPAEGE